MIVPPLVFNIFTTPPCVCMVPCKPCASSCVPALCYCVTLRIKKIFPLRGLHMPMYLRMYVLRCIHGIWCTSILLCPYCVPLRIEKIIIVTRTSMWCIACSWMIPGVMPDLHLVTAFLRFIIVFLRLVIASLRVKKIARRPNARGLNSLSLPLLSSWRLRPIHPCSFKRCGRSGARPSIFWFSWGNSGVPASPLVPNAQTHKEGQGKEEQEKRGKVQHPCFFSFFFNTITPITYAYNQHALNDFCVE